MNFISQPTKVVVVTGFLALLSAGCTTLQQKEPPVIDQIAYGYGAVTGLRSLATNDVAMSVEEAKAVQNLADKIRAILDEARTAFYAGDTSNTVFVKINNAVTLIAQLQSLVAAGKQVKAVSTSGGLAEVATALIEVSRSETLVIDLIAQAHSRAIQLSPTDFTAITNADDMAKSALDTRLQK